METGAKLKDCRKPAIENRETDLEPDEATPAPEVADEDEGVNESAAELKMGELHSETDGRAGDNDSGSVHFTEAV